MNDTTENTYRNLGDVPRHWRDVANGLVEDIAEEVTLDDDGSDAARRLVIKLAVKNEAVVIERVFVFLPSPRRRLPNHPAANGLIIDLIDTLPFGLRTGRALWVGLFVLDPFDPSQGAACGTSRSLLCTSHERRPKVRGGGSQVASVIRRHPSSSYILYKFVWFADRRK